MKKFITIISLLLFFHFTNAQLMERLEPGVSGIYNFQSAGIGFGLRAVYHVNDRISITPQYNKFLGFNEYTEFYAGASLQYNFTSTWVWGIYGMVAGSFNKWENSEDFSPDENLKNNIAIEPGVGIVKNNGCTKPFAEVRYNIDWKETNVRVGLLFNIFNCNFGSSAGKKSSGCPAYN